MLPLIPAVGLLSILAIVVLVASLVQKRKEIDGLPQPPMPNKLLGHLYLAFELRRLFPKGCHGQVWGDYIRIKYNMPDVFYVDWRPLGPLMVFIADPTIAAHPIVTTASVPKSKAIKKEMNRILGNKNLITAHGAEWRALRGLFSPAFQHQHLRSLTDSVVDSCLTLCEILRENAEGRVLFKLNEVTLRTTIEMICGVIFGHHVACQRSLHTMTRLFLDRIHMMPNAMFLWEVVRPLRVFELHHNKLKLDASINSEIDTCLTRRLADRLGDLDVGGGTEKSFGTDKARSILGLALKTYEQERGMPITHPSLMPPNLRTDVVDSIKAFIFAGYDATAATICWALYLLHRNPEAQARLTEELDDVFPASCAGTAQAIKDDHLLVGTKLPYTTAVIKETLRLFPPASGLRSGPLQRETLLDPVSGQQFPVYPHSAVWPCAHMIHRNPHFFPEPLRFVPERWIRHLTPFPDAQLFTVAGKDAFRAFGKGPRACIGSDLAMLQMRIVLALAAREFDFVPEYPGEDADIQFPIPADIVGELSDATEYGRGVRNKTTTRDRIEGHRMYMQLLMIGKPVGGAPGRIYKRPSY